MLEQFERIGNQIFKRVLIKKGASRNALIHLPDDYETNPEKKYPLLVFHCGSGETWSAAKKKNITPEVKIMLNQGPPLLISKGEKFHVKNPNTGEIEKFIVLSLQQDSTGYALGPDAISYAWENEPLIKDRINPKAIFVTGLSLGGTATSYFFSDQYADNYLHKVTALLPMSASPLTGSSFNFKKIQEMKTPVWAFCGKTDKPGFVNFAKQMEQNVPGLKMTWYTGGHCCWTDQYKNMALYEWCLAQVKSEIPVQEGVKVISVTDASPARIVVEGPAVIKTAILKLGSVDVFYNVV